MAESKTFTPLANVRLPTSCRLLPSSCCPDKDLVVLASHVAGRSRVSLWTIQGYKKWDIDMGIDETEDIVDVAWSPNGQSISIAHDPPKITVHSIQDGREELALPVHITPDPRRQALHLTGLWWFEHEKKGETGSIPDIFRRKDVITGSAHSVLRALPLLDYLEEDSHKVTATDLFAFQGTQMRSTQKSSLPDAIKAWPVLPSNALLSSMCDPKRPNEIAAQRGALADDEDLNVNSVLVAVDDIGYVHFYLDGTYPLGTTSTSSEMPTSSLHKARAAWTFSVHPRRQCGNMTVTDLRSSVIQLPLLQQRSLRDMALLSTTARDLLWYAMRVVREMRSVWFGSDTYSGAREFGPKWLRALENKQQDQFGQDEPNSILELTSLLVTGRASDSLIDFLGSNEYTSERGILKWESTMVEALVKLRDFSEKRLAPACQRLHIVLEEVHGWSLLSQFVSFDLPTEEIGECLNSVARAVVIANWLAAVVRRELARFKEFMKWLRFEIACHHNSETLTGPPRHDVLEVNKYFMSGLVVCSIDKWFMGPAPHFSPSDLGVMDETLDLSAALSQAQKALDGLKSRASEPSIKYKDLSHLDRNLDALIQELTTRCQRVFVRASRAATRIAVVSGGPDSLTAFGDEARPAAPSTGVSIVRERVVGSAVCHHWKEIAVEIECFHKNDECQQYLALYTKSGNQNLLCFARLNYGVDMSRSSVQPEVALLRCCAPDILDQTHVDEFELLELEFFDAESVVIVYRKNIDGPSFLATVTYNDLGYQKLMVDDYVSIRTREDLMAWGIERWSQGLLPSVPIPIKKSRELSLGRGEGVYLAVNGRAGRRVACILDGQGNSMETFDLEGEGEEEDLEDLEVETGT